MVRILSFDTSKPELTLALFEDGDIVASDCIKPSEASRQEAVSRLMPGIDRMMRERQWLPESLDLVVVGRGPGSFTGIRVAVVTARTLGQALNLPVMGIDALRCHARQAGELGAPGAPGAVVLSGGRGHFFAASFVFEKRLQFAVQPCHINEDELLKLIESQEVSFVEADVLKYLPDSLMSKCRLLSDSVNLAVSQAKLAWEDLYDIAKDRETLRTMYPFAAVNPLYLRGASVTLKKAGIQA